MTIETIVERYGNTKIVKLRRAVDDLRQAIRNEGTPAIQDAWDRAEPWVDRIFVTESE